MDFKEYYHKKLDEEFAAEEAARSEAEQSYTTQAMGSNTQSLINQYVKNGDLKDGFKNLGQDLVKAIVDYAKTQLVNDEMFSSVDSQQKYMNFIDQKIGLTAGSTLTDLLKHIAIDISNSKNTFTD